MSTPLLSNALADGSAATHSEQDRADIALLQRLVEIESLSGQEQEAVAYLVGEMERRGFATEIDAAGNAIGRLGSGDQHIVLLGHIDTVPGRIPVRIEDGVLHGRGSVDAKGPLATFVAAATRAADRLNARVTVVGAVGEETMGSPGATEVSQWPAPDACIIGEPSGWDAVCLGYRGTMTARYRFVQESRHTAGPGESAGEHAISFWNAVMADLEERNAALPGSSLFNVVSPALRSFNTISTGLEDIAEMVVGFRLPPGLDVDSLIARLHDLAGDAELTIEGPQHGYRTDKRSPLTPPFLRAIRAEGGSPRFTVKLGTSDMTVVGPKWGCPIVAYGPGDAALDHTPVERQVISEYLAAIRILANVLAAF